MIAFYVLLDNMTVRSSSRKSGMRSFSFFLVATFIVFAVPHHAIMAAECRTVELPEHMNQDTRSSLVTLAERFSSYNLDTNLRSERNGIILDDNEDADQQLFIDVFYTKFCELIKEPRWSLPPDNQKKHRDLAFEQLYKKALFGAPIVDTRWLSFYQSGPQTQFVASVDGEDVQFQHANLTSTDNSFYNRLVDNHVDTIDAPSEYLRGTPYVVTKANKNFVMVSSWSSKKGALKAVEDLKREAPQFDFIAYEPYDTDDPKFGIMMATWVPWAVANAALKDAKEAGLTGSIIWSCRSRGSSC